MSMTETVLKTGKPAPEAAASALDAGHMSHEEWLDFGARMEARRPIKKQWENTGITIEDSIQALRIAVEEDLLSFVELDQR
jgi:hypothetical protein